MIIPLSGNRIFDLQCKKVTNSQEHEMKIALGGNNKHFGDSSDSLDAGRAHSTNDQILLVPFNISVHTFFFAL